MIFFSFISSCVLAASIGMISYYIFGTRVNMIFVYSLVWYSLLFMVVINPGNYYPISATTLLLFYACPLIVLMGSIFSSVLVKEQKVVKNIQSIVINVDFGLIDKFLTILLFFTSIFIAYTMAQIINIYGVDLQGLRDITYSNDGYKTFPILEKLSALKWFMQGILLYLLTKTIYILIYIKKIQALKYAIFALAAMIIVNVSGGGRGAALELITLFGIIFLINAPISNSMKKYIAFRTYKKSMFSLVLLCIFVLIFVTFYRNEEISVIESLYMTFVKYFLGPFYAFDQKLQYVTELDLSRFGMSIMGLDTILISGFARFLFGMNISSLISESSFFYHTGIEIGNGETMNAFYTSIFSLMIDGGLYYTILFLFIIGFVASIVSRNFYQKVSYGSFVLMIFFYYYLITASRISAFELPGWIIFLVTPFLMKLFDFKLR